MATKKKMLQAAAGNAGGEALNVEDVFSTYLYEGTGSTQTITNGIDLDGEGGLVWVKVRSQTQQHALFDTERGATKYLKSSSTGAETTRTDTLTSFNSNGFSLGNDSSGALVNTSGQDYASWTFRKAPKFFDVGTISFDGSGVGSYSHNLGVTPAVVIFKLTNTTGDWFVWHKDLTSQNYALFLNDSAAQSNQGGWATYTDTTVSFDSSVFANDTAVVYLFAHNDGDGEFGPDGDADIIKCGSYTGTDGDHDIDLGFEPQWIMFKRTNEAAGWQVFDVMRGIPTGGNQASLAPNESTAEYNNTNYGVAVNPTGFSLSGSSAFTNDLNDTYIYIAIRRGTKVPESGDEVFAIDTAGSTAPSPPQWTSGFVTDFALHRTVNTANSTRAVSRLTGEGELFTNLTNAEGTDVDLHWDYMNGFWDGSTVNANQYAWLWKRAPKFFDSVAYTGNGTAGRTVSHNLGVAPEMMIFKRRSGVSGWSVYTAPTGNSSWLQLESVASVESSVLWAGTTPTSEVFYVTDDSGAVNASGETYIAYLFSTLAGISKVGSYTGNGSSQTINCGFTSGARFILIKRTDASGAWYVWDTERGIVAGNDPHLSLNTTAAEVTSDDSIDPDSSGFIVNQFAATNINVSSAEYIFYAVA